jgi:WD40 repeat protein
MNVSMRENQVLASYGNKLVSYDLRGSVIITSASSTFYYSSDDINQISAHNNYLALPDDSGLISILNTTTPSPVCTNTLAGHTEVKFTQICTSAAFLDDQLLMSVGFDLQIMVWDYIRNIEVKRFNIGTLYLAEILGANYINPPYPYSVAYKHSRVAIATGNGNVIFYDTEQLSLVRIKQPLRVLEAHRASVCHAHWANYTENLLITASSDKCVCLVSSGDVSRRIELDYKVK